MTTHIGNVNAWDLVVYSIHWHCHKFKGKYPKILLLHPLFMDKLRTDKRAVYELHFNPLGEVFFDNIPILVRKDYDWAGLIAVDGSLELI